MATIKPTTLISFCWLNFIEPKNKVAFAIMSLIYSALIALMALMACMAFILMELQPVFLYLTQVYEQ